jgi:hypothetical protein
MSLSRKLIERLIHDEVNLKSEYENFDKEQLSNLAQQIFLSQITQTDSKEQKKSIQDKIEHFHALMKDGDIK